VLPISETIQQLQALATEKAITLNLQMAPVSVAQTQLTEQIAALQTLANEKAILLNTTLTPKTTTGKKGRGKAAATGTTTAANTIPFEGVVENVVVSKSVKVTGGPVKVEGLVENVKAGKGMKPIEVKANVVAPGLNNQVNALRELSNVWKTLPKTGGRTYTVNLKMPGIENLAKLKELQGIVGSMAPSQRRVYNNALGNGGRGNSGTSTTGVYGGGRRADTRFAGRPRGTMNTFAYQLMGNTSLGARTPVFLDMMKGMGMMTGVGAAMGTLTTAFTNASEYQNTMVTAKSILEANYQGSDFNKDFGNMERIVRDVAKKTKFTAPQAADAARFMAMAGLNIPMINASIRPIADVAVIGDNDLGEVADKITNIQTAFGIQPNKMRALADALTKTFTSSNTDMMMLAESMEYAAPMAHLAGAQVEDALAMIGIMGNAGIQGSMAGTTLRMMYQNVINPNKKQKKMWESLGISLKDAQGNPRQLIEILGDLRKKVRISREDKDEEGRFKDEGTPIASAVSQLFRVTASAGAGTLLENLDKVIALAEANKNAEGLSQRISEVKQNDVKGMWAKMTSAFTDAVVTEFEQQDSPIKGYLENITKYFNSGEFKDLLHDIFDLVTSMMDMLGKFVKIWREIYKIFGPIIKYTLMAQFILTQIGYMLAPLRSIYMTIARGAGVLSGVAGGGAAVSAAGSISGTGVMAASGAAPLLSFGSKRANYNTAAIQAARTAAMQSEVALANSRKYLAAATALDAATTPGLRRSMEKKQMQWYVASQYAGSGPGSHALRSSDNRSGRWNLAYTNPQAASELPNRFKIMSAREREVAALQEQLRRRGTNLSAAEAAVLANTASNINARRALNSRIADVRHGARRVDTAVLNRAVQMGKISRGRAMAMSLSSGFRTAATWGVTGASAVSLMGGLTSVVSGIGTALGALLNPITLTVVALGGLGYAIWSANKKFREQNEKWQKQINESGNAINQQLKEAWGVNDSISSIFENIKTINVNTASINVENEQKVASPIAKSEEYSAAYEALMGKLYFSPSVKGFSSVAGISYDTWGAMYDQYVAPMKAIYGNMPDRDSFMKMANGNGRVKDQASNAMLVTKAIIGQKAILSDEYKNAEAQIKDIRTKYANLPKDERLAKWSEYQESINSIISQFNPLNKYGLTSITRSNFQTALNATPVQFKEYYEALYNSLQKYSNEAIGMEMVNGLHAFDVGVKENTDAWWDAIGKVVGAFAWSADGNEEHTVFFPMQNGVVQLNQLSEELKKKNYIVVDKVRTYVQNLSTIYDTIYNDPQLKGVLGELSKEEFLKHLLHQPTYWDNIILPNGQTPNGQIDSAIDEFIGVQSPFLPPANSNQFNHKMWQFPWVGGMNQSIYKNPQGNGPFAQAAPPNITFSGPLIKIDNIKGGDGVTPEELKNAVAQAVTETLTYISKPTWQS
jgi:TP901 family phage tail tape measure protein